MIFYGTMVKHGTVRFVTNNITSNDDVARFNDKRTPSWTDRVLWRGFRDDEPGHPQQHTNTTFASVPEVITSDHEPVYCLLGLPSERNERR